jgi:hypothetical protein
MRKIIKLLSLPYFKVKLQYTIDSRGMGRFGGGWNWQVGIQAGGPSVLIHLLICTLRFDFVR